MDILRKSMLKFREHFIELENIDPLQYVTIASVCMSVYRGNYMPSGVIATLTDTTNYESCSTTSIAWLDWLIADSGVKIQHALNCDVVNLDKIGKVDGFCKDTKTVYEFQGCFWHGCRKCYNGDTINTKNQIDMLSLRKQTLKKNEKNQIRRLQLDRNVRMRSEKKSLNSRNI